MINKSTTADARKKCANLINRVAFGDESFVPTRRGEAVAAIVSMNGLKGSSIEAEFSDFDIPRGVSSLIERLVSNIDQSEGRFAPQS